MKDTTIAILLWYLTTCVFILCTGETKKEEVHDMSYDFQTNEDIKQLADKQDILFDTNTWENFISFWHNNYHVISSIGAAVALGWII